MGKVRVILQFFVYKLCMPVFPAVLAWLHWQVWNKCAHKSTCYCFFTRIKRPLHEPFPRYATIRGLQLRSKLVVSSYWPFKSNTGTSIVDGGTEQLLGDSGPHTVHHMCSYTCRKGSQLWILIFREKYRWCWDKNLPCRKIPSEVIRCNKLI